ncbi:hypothetical protein DAEQUDRAFT_724644 [Daedalea quercina L-15889]|uniref:Uncharacterized protein n=1 Tax=Daedalea quercina L-15889 TaxID=1314783 RepID=A0A165RLA7_9APHY|nr:hypothetical protein DAEQUDRAFT_724644 [Daedalea quercina L-15889]
MVVDPFFELTTLTVNTYTLGKAFTSMMLCRVPFGINCLITIYAYSTSSEQADRRVFDLDLDLGAIKTA